MARNQIGLAFGTGAVKVAPVKPVKLLAQTSVADMPGPLFLVFYGVFAACLLALVWWWLWRKDRTRGERLPPVPIEPDPREIACLRGGERELAHLLVFELIQRGFLEAAPRSRGSLRQRAQHPDLQGLSQLELTVFDWFRRPLKVPHILHKARASVLFRDYCRGVNEKLRAERLLLPVRLRRECAWLIRLTAFGLIGIAGYKLGVAWVKGYTNVLFLVTMSATSVALLFLLPYWTLPRLSAKGRRYVKRLQLAFEKLKWHKRIATHSADPNLLLLAGVFGLGSLSGTLAGYYARLFKRRYFGVGDPYGGDLAGCGGGFEAGTDGGGGGGGCGGCGD